MFNNEFPRLMNPPVVAERERSADRDIEKTEPSSDNKTEGPPPSGPRHYFSSRHLLILKDSDFDKDCTGKGGPPPAPPKITAPGTTNDQGQANFTREANACEKLFLGFGLGKGGPGDHGPKFIRPVNTLKDCKRYQPSARDAGSILQIRMVNQWPHQQDEGRPYFELEELSGTYQEMERDMVKTYAQFAGDPITSLGDLHQDFYGVLEDYGDDDRVILKRVKLIDQPLKFKDGTPHAVDVELIDEYFVRMVEASEVILFLDESFARLPPRVTGIEMEGMSHYRNNEFFKRFVRWNSDEFLFEGILEAEVQPSGKVVIWSDRFPRTKYPYGINGFIVKSIIETTQAKACALPALGPKRELFVVHADNDGYVWLQFKNDISSHLLQLCDTISYEELFDMRGSVTFADLELDKRNAVIYFAPHEKSDGTQYRVVVIPSPEMIAEKVRVRFIDYGDEAWVTVEDLVRAADVHYLLPHFPPICVQAHLRNIWDLDVKSYVARFHNSEELSYTAHVVQGATPEEPAEVVLFPSPTDAGPPSCELSVNEQLLKTGLAQPIDPLFVYEGCTGLSPQQPGPIIKLYLGLGQGQRLAVGDEFQASLSYYGRMGTFMFIKPCHRIPKLEALEDELRENFRDQAPGVKPLRIRTVLRVPGTSANCYSPTLKRYCRGILVRETEDYFPVPGQEPVKLYCWRTYLVDHGLFENFTLSHMRMLNPAQADMPALGIRVVNWNLPTKETVTHWWMRTWRKNGIGDLETLVRVICISNDEYGEIAEVDFPALEMGIEKMRTSDSSGSFPESGGSESGN